MNQPELSLFSVAPCETRTPPKVTRKIKIEASGDFWAGEVKPKIRLCGRWLEQAGFKPGHYVQVTHRSNGTLTLQFIEQSSEAKEPF